MGFLNRDWVDFNFLGGGETRGDHLTPDALFRTDDILVYGNGEGLVERIDPGSTPSPIDDHIAPDRTFILPHGSITDNSLGGVIPARVNIFGQGIGASVLNVTSALQFDGNSDQITLDGFTLKGPGDDAAATNALEFVGSCSNSSFGTLMGLGIHNYYGSAIDFGAGKPFELLFGAIKVGKTDAGNVNGVLNVDSIGPSVVMNRVTMYPTATTSGVNSTGVYANHTGQFTLPSLNIGGTTGIGFDGVTGLPNNVGEINYEPSSQPGGTPAYAVGIESQTQIDAVRLTSGTVSYGVRFTGRSGEPSKLGGISSAATVTNSLVEVSGDPATAPTVAIESASVDNTTGLVLANEGVFCKGDLVRKKSVGVGYDGGTDDSKL